MQSKKIRKRGLISKKKYNLGGSVDCPNPPCPPGNEIGSVAQRLIDSGAWKLGPNGELLRLSPEEMNQAAYQRSRSQAMRELAVEDPSTFAPTTLGFMTPERKAYLESRAGKLTPEEAREYATVSFDPFEGPNMAFSFAAGATPLDPVGQIIGRGLTAASQGWRALKNPRVLPIMEEARMEASIQGIREHFGIELGHIVDGEVMTPEKMRQIVIKDLVGENASGERLARANQAIDKAIDEAMPGALETVMRRSEGNILDIPVDTRYPEADRVRMRFLGPNSKLWQQANKDGLIPVTNIKQAMSNMSEMERSVLEEAIFSAPVYNKQGVLLQGEELRNAQDAIISAVARTGMGPSIEESAEGIGDISGYRVKLNQLKGLTESTSATMNPIRSFELEHNGEDFFGNKIGQSSNPFRGDTYSNYGINRIGYDGVNSSTFVVGSDNLYSTVNHFGRGELSHFRVFTDDSTYPKTSNFFPGTEIDVPYEFGQIRLSYPLGTGSLEWFQDMSRVPSGLGYTRGGNVSMPIGYSDSIQKSVTNYLNNDVSTREVARNVRSGLEQFDEINIDGAKIIHKISKVHQIAADVSSGRGSIVGPKGDHIVKELLEFANSPDRKEIINETVSGTDWTGRDNAWRFNLLFDELVKTVAKEQDLLARFGESNLPENIVGEPIIKLRGTYRYLSVYEDVIHDLTSPTFLRIQQNYKPYDNMIDMAETDFSFGTWTDYNFGESLDILQGDIMLTAKNRFNDNFDDRIKDLNTFTLGPKTPPEVKKVSSDLMSKLGGLQGKGNEYFDEMHEIASQASITHQSLMNKYTVAYNEAKSRGVPDHLLMKTAVEELQPQVAGDLEKLKKLILELDAKRREAIVYMSDAAKSLDRINDDVVRLVPDLYESSKVEVKNRFDNIFQNQTSIDYYDILETQNHIRDLTKIIEDNILNGNINNVQLSKIFLEPPNKDKFFVSEIQSDFVQKSSGKEANEMRVISKPTNDDWSTTRKGERAELDSFQKNWRTKTIQQAVLQGRKAGKNEILFPTYSTANKIQGWEGRMNESGSGAGNRITYQSMDKHIQKATGIKPTLYTDSKGNEWWMIKLDPNQKYEFPDFKFGGKIRLRKK